ncbi:MAG: hypothetical protein WD278_15485 [Pirellulales bacterium]
MNESEEEYLLHIAAGCDPLTAWAATPGPDPTDRPPTPQRSSSATACGVLAALVAFIVWLIAR